MYAYNVWKKIKKKHSKINNITWILLTEIKKKET